MTDAEKADNPGYETTGGYLKQVGLKEAFREMWKGLSDDQRECIKSIPNFDAQKFEKITGVNVDIELERHNMKRL